MPKISVITPIYKTEKYLSQCLQSLASQSLQDIELIWVDNGASDEAREIITMYKKLREQITVIHLPENIGYGGAMNAGLAVASGEYVGFCDSDDWVDDDYFEKLYSKAKNDNADIVFTNYVNEFQDSSLVSPHVANIEKSDILVDKINILKNGAIWDKIFKRELLQNYDILFPKASKSFYEDNVLLIQAIHRANMISTIDHPLYHYRKNDNSIMHSADLIEKRREGSVTVISFLLNYAIANNFSKEEKIATCNFMFRSLSLNNVLKNKILYTKLLKSIEQDSFIINYLEHKRFFFCPPFWQKIFSIQQGFNRKVLWIAGFRILLKKNTNKGL